MTHTPQNQNAPARRKLSLDLLEELNMLSALANRTIETTVPSPQK